MSFKKLQEFIDLAKAAGASELSYKDGEKEFKVEFAQANQSHLGQSPTFSHQVSSETLMPDIPQSKASDLVDITSPFVGTFYTSSGPGEAAFISVGDKITEGKVLCIIEAMKIMNEIEAEISGEIVEICVENESYVPYGEVLFRVKRN